MKFERMILLRSGVVFVGSLPFGMMGAHSIQASLTALCSVVMFFNSRVKIAKAGFEHRRAVTWFQAAEAVQLLRPEVLKGLKGLGTGSLGEHLAELRPGGRRVFASGIFAARKGIKKTDVGELDVGFAPPRQRTRLAAEADKVLCY